MQRLFNKTDLQPIFAKVPYSDFASSSWRKEYGDKWGWKGYLEDVVLEGDKSKVEEYLIKPFWSVLLEGAKIAENNIVLMHEFKEKERKQKSKK